MKRWGFVFVLMLAIVALLVVGCEDGEEATPTPTATPEATPTATPEATPTPTPTATLPPDGELADILGLTSAIESVKYDTSTTYQGMVIDSTVWQKPNKMKTETTMEGMTIVTYIDFDAQRLCAYAPDLGMVLPVDFGEAPPDPLLSAETVEQYQPTVIGSETIDGKDCLVYEWTAEGVTVKTWVAKDTGFPVRQQVTTPEGVMTVEYTNIEFVDIPDSVFEFPPECG